MRASISIERTDFDWKITGNRNEHDGRWQLVAPSHTVFGNFTAAELRAVALHFLDLADDLAEREADQDVAVAR